MVCRCCGDHSSLHPIWAAVCQATGHSSDDPGSWCAGVVAITAAIILFGQSPAKDLAAVPKVDEVVETSKRRFTRAASSVKAPDLTSLPSASHAHQQCLRIALAASAQCTSCPEYTDRMKRWPPGWDQSQLILPHFIDWKHMNTESHRDQAPPPPPSSPGRGRESGKLASENEQSALARRLFTAISVERLWPLPKVVEDATNYRP